MTDDRTPVIGRWFCPDHADEFWVPHGGQCPEPGCECALEEYVPVSEVERLRAEIKRLREIIRGAGLEDGYA